MKLERPGLEIDMRSMIVLLVVALLGLGCGENVTKSKSGNTSNNTTTNNTSTNNSTTNNSTTNNSTIIVVEGEVLLKVTQALQTSGASFMVNIQIANGLPESIGISPSLFRLGVGGLEITSVDLEQSTCPTDALISAGATHQCLIYFNDVEAEPDRLIYVGSGDPIVAEFTPTACETCGTQNCIDLRSSSEHCGTCDNVVGQDQTCQDGMIECGTDFRSVEGFCIPDNNDIELLPLALNSVESCYGVCNFKSCEGVLFRGECNGESPFGDPQQYPGLGFCESRGTEAASFATEFGCTVEAMFCACY